MTYIVSSGTLNPTIPYYTMHTILDTLFVDSWKCFFCVFSSFHWVLSAGGQAQLEDGLESPHLLGNLL